MPNLVSPTPTRTPTSGDDAASRGGAASAQIAAPSLPAHVDRQTGVHDRDAMLVQAARQGDRAAFARLHEQYAPMVHAIALARVPAAEAHDLTQEVFLHALDRLRLLRDDRAFGSWLATITRNLAIEFHRRKQLRLHEELPAQMTASVNAATPSSGAIERAQRVLQAIRSLPESYAETLVLRLIAGLTGPQIAACLGLTHGSVRVNLHRGMRMLQEQMKEMNISLKDSP